MAGPGPRARSLEGIAAFWGGTTIAELAQAMEKALSDHRLSLVHVPVYWGADPLGGLGAWGRWNVGSEPSSVQALRHEIGL